MKLLKDLDVSGKKVFLRADLDVNVENSKLETRNSKQEIQEQATRLTNLTPTVDYLLEHGARQVIIAGHIDRPQKPDPALSTKQLLGPLEKILGKEIAFAPYTPGVYGSFTPGVQNVCLLENLRFWPGETQNDNDFAAQLAALAEVYVNDAFGNCHRNHASMVALSALLPHAAGLHLQKEVEVLSALLNEPQRPFVAIVGGAKIETKVPVIENLAKIADRVIVGGELPIEIAKNGSKYPQNVVVATLEDNQKDVAYSSMIQIIALIKGAKTVVWNGPMGVFEEGFEKGTVEVANAIVGSGAYSVVGGGDTTQFLAPKNFLSRFSFVSSGGGAMLEFLAGSSLPGLVALE